MIGLVSLGCCAEEGDGGSCRASRFELAKSSATLGRQLHHVGVAVALPPLSRCGSTTAAPTRAFPRGAWERDYSRNKKSPPPERTPATGSCGCLTTGAADTLSTAMNLAQVVAHFQEEKTKIANCRFWLARSATHRVIESWPLPISRSSYSEAARIPTRRVARQ